MRHESQFQRLENNSAVRMQDMIKGPNLNNAVNQYLEEPIAASNFVVTDATGHGQD